MRCRYTSYNRPQPLVNHPALVGFGFSFSLLDGCFGSILPNRQIFSLCCKGLQLVKFGFDFLFVSQL